MEIIVGRNSQTRQLNIVTNGTVKTFGQAGSVPLDVSRNHISLQPAGNGKWKIKNLNNQNITFVNGIAVESKTISESDKVELGNSHYLFSWAALQEPKVETVDIRPLKKIWENYNSSNINIRKRQKDNGLLASIPMVFTVLGGVISGIAPDDLRPFAICLTVIALILMIYGWYKRYSDNSIEETEVIKKDFQKRYVCPKCGHFMGFQDYDILTQGDACPYCRTKYEK